MKKSLLTESEIRKFMKFANIDGSAAENFVETIQEEWGSKEDEYKRRDGKKAGDIGGHFKDDEMDESLEEEEIVTEEGVNEEEDVVTEEEEVNEEEEITEEVLTEDDVDVKELVRKLMQVISDETGVEAEVIDDEEAVDDEEIVDDEEVVDDEIEVGDDELAGDETFVGDELEAGDMDDMAPDDEVEDLEDLGETEGTDVALTEMDALVDEVTKRVAARLLDQ